MRIGIDTAPIHQHRSRGVGALGTHLLGALLRAETSHRFLLFSPEGDLPGFLAVEGGQPEIVRRPAVEGGFSLDWLRDAWRLRQQVGRMRPDVFHAFFQWNLPLRRSPVPVAGHIYDLMPMAVRGIYTRRYRLPVGVKISLYERYLKFALGRVDRAIAISRHSRDDLVRLTGYPEERIRVVHPAPAPGMGMPEEAGVAALRERLGLREDYLLYVGGFDYRKNLEVLLGAHRLARKRGMNLPLALAGGMDSPYGKLVRSLVEDEAGEGGVRLLGHIPDKDLPALYGGARLFLYPSLYEGFGLPVLDAMACGAPVVCSNAASLPEAAGDAAVLVDPGDEEAWAEAIVRCAGDEELRGGMRRRGLAHAGEFSWDRAARETLAVYEELAGGA